jgi:hypothetical protein
MAGLVPAIHALHRGTKNVDARAFASPKRLRPRRRDKPGHDDLPRTSALRHECVTLRNDDPTAPELPS